MSYESENIFDKKINAICDLIINTLHSQFPADDDMDIDFIYKSVILSGKASAILQSHATGSIRNITFECKLQTVFDWCAANLSQVLFNCKVIVFKERILLYPQGYIFEIWKCEEIVGLIHQGSNVYIQNHTSIPTETL